MNKKIIVDTSIWIEYFKNNSSVTRVIDEGLDANRIYIVGPIISELIQGVKSDKELNLLLKYIDAIPSIEYKTQNWIDAGHISYILRKKGITIPLTDVIIASIAINNNGIVYTNDKHFNMIPNLELF